MVSLHFQGGVEGFTEFPKVFHGVLPSFQGFYLFFFTGYTRFDWVSRGFEGSYWVLLGLMGFD